MYTRKISCSSAVRDTSFVTAPGLHLTWNHVFTFIFLPLFIFPLVVAVMAGGAWIYQLWGYNSMYGLAVPECKPPGRTKHPTQDSCVLGAPRGTWCLAFAHGQLGNQFLRRNQKLGTLVYPSSEHWEFFLDHGLATSTKQSSVVNFSFLLCYWTK